MMRTPEEWLAFRLEAVNHVVHDYAILISAGELTQRHHVPPINSHIQYSFLVACRKLAGFFLNLREKNDILSKEFLPGKQVGFKVPLWKDVWHEAMNRQLLHLSYDRVDKAKSWDGKDNAELLRQFRKEWKKFLGSLEDPFDARFAKEIAAKKSSEYGSYGLD
jgi:hypothetical protein